MRCSDARMRVACLSACLYTAPPRLLSLKEVERVVQSKLRAGGLKHLAEFPQLDFPRKSKCVVLKPPAKDPRPCRSWSTA
jgi:hypothetical protein